MKFADSDYEYKDSRYVIFGVPFDGTTSFRPGSRFAPNSIRIASKNLESFVYENRVNMREKVINDLGDLEEFGNVDDVIKEVKFTIDKIMDDGKFPIMLGGEHSITAGAALSIKDRDYSIIFIDAHSDFRDEYLGVKYSHACVARRAFEILGENRVFSIGVRSVSMEEYNSEDFKKYIHFPSYIVHSVGMENVLDNLEKYLGNNKIYLSIDMDGIDPSYAPGVATPEPFGISPWDLKYLIEKFSKKIVGADIVEISPPYDNGNTSMLGARLIQEIISRTQ
ncbi:MAG: agmatinase [Thermoplasmata archaeon]